MSALLVLARAAAATWVILLLAVYPVGLRAAQPFALSGGDHGTGGLHQCTDVAWMTDAPLPSKLASQVSTRAVGSLIHATTTASYSRNNVDPRRVLSREVQQLGARDVDFLVVFTTFDFEMGGAFAFYNAVQNDVEGIGQPLFDRSAAFGSDGRLQGYVDMGRVGRYSFARRDPNWPTAHKILAHELMHRWGVSLRYHDGSGPSRELIGQADSHWSALLDTEASILYGAKWQQTASGEFRSVEAFQRLGMWDLYLAGWASPDELPSLQLIRSTGLDPRATPQVGLEIVGQVETIQPEQVVQAEGPRIPDSSRAQRHFSAQLVLLSRPGETPDPAVLIQLERFRLDFESYFQSITRGRASLSFSRAATAQAPAVSAPPSLPVLVGQVPADPLTSAITWLKLQQRADGRFEDRPGSVLRDTVIATAAIAQVEPAFPGTAAARQWIDHHSPRHVDDLVWLGRSPGAREPPALGQVREGWQESPFDLASALRSDVERGWLSAAHRDELVLRLIQSQLPSGSTPAHAEGATNIAATIWAGAALSRSTNPAAVAAFQSARAFLAGRFNEAEDELGVEGIAEILLDPSAFPLHPFERSELIRQLLQSQGEQGDWRGSVYATALATLALASIEQPNLQIGVGELVPADPVLGAPFVLRQRVRNTGGTSAPASSLRWYGLVDSETPLADAPTGLVSIPPLLGGESVTLEPVLETEALPGVRKIRVQLDADQLVNESNEDDNAANYDIAIANRSGSADPAVFASDFAVSPDPVSGTGESVRVTGKLRNLGEQPLAGVALSLRGASGSELVATHVDLPAAGHVLLSLEFILADLTDAQLELLVDPQNLLAEPDESNNRVLIRLQLGERSDLVLPATTLRVSPTSPSTGQDVEIRIDVMNLGARDAAESDLVLERFNGTDGWTRLDRARFPLPASGTVQRSFRWRADVPGTHRFRLLADAEDELAEADEANNQHEFDVEVVEPEGANLELTAGSLLIAPLPALQGKALRAELQVRNVGRSPAGAFTTALFIGDPATGGERIAGLRRTEGLDAGAGTNIALEVAEFPAAGDLTLFAQVDAEYEQIESSENDNLAILEIVSLRRADLALASSSLRLQPAAPVPGQTVTAFLEVANLGEQPSPIALVELSERSNGIPRSVGDRQTLPPIPPGLSTTVEWTWQFAEGGPADMLVARVDPENVVREFDEGNNSLSIAVDAQDSGSFVSDRYISPDGDGVQDYVDAYFDLVSGQPSKAVVRDAQGHHILDLQIERVDASSLWRARWTGDDRRGDVAPDGFYRIEITDAAGSALASTFTTVDRNRPAVLEAVGTDRAVRVSLPSIEGPWLRTPVSSPANEYVFALARPDNPQSHLRRGVLRSHVLLGDVELMISERWLDQRARQLGIDTLDIESLYFHADQGTLVLFAREMDGGTATRSVWVADPLGVDQASRLTTLSGLDAPPNVIASLSNGRLLMGSEAPHGSRHVLDLGDGSWLPLSHQEAGARILDVDARGIAFGQREAHGSDRVDSYLDLDAGSLVDLTDLDVHVPTQLCFRRSQFHPTLPLQMVHQQDHSGYESVWLIDLRRGQEQRLLHLRSDVASCLASRSPNKRTSAEDTSPAPSLAEARAFWNERQGTLWITDFRNRTLAKFDAQGRPIGETPLPSPPVITAYSEFGGYIEPFARSGEPSGPTHLCTGRLGGDWQSLIRARGHARGRVDMASESLYLTLGDTVGGYDDYFGQVSYCEGATRFLRLGSEGSVHEMSTATRWPISDPIEAARYPAAVVGPEGPRVPESWPRYIHRNGTTLRSNGEVSLPGSISGRRWNDAQAFLDIWEDETRADLATVPGTGQVGAVLSTLDRMGAILLASSDGRSVRLFGLASDRNFAYYRIDYALAGDPESWQTLVAPASHEILFEDFLGWAPPAAGAYLFRLTVADKAGNRLQRFASAEVSFPAPLGSIRQNHRYLSPNGDGVQDELVIGYQVLRPHQQTFEISDSAGRVVLTQTLTYDAGQLGPAQWLWDGRDQSGQPVTEGRYRIGLSSGFQFRVVVDRTAPELTASITPQYPPVDQKIRHCAGDRMGQQAGTLDGVVLERRKTVTGPWSLWQEIRDCAPPSSMIDPDPGIKFGAQDRLKYQYRVLARDLAGNDTEVVFPFPTPALYLERIEGSAFESSWGTLPPTYASPDPPSVTSKEVRVAGFVASPSDSVPLDLLWNQGPLPSDLAVDLARLTGVPEQPLVWQTVLQEGFRSGDGARVSAAIDLRAQFNRRVALRLRSRAQSVISNLQGIQVGGIAALSNRYVWATTDMSVDGERIQESRALEALGGSLQDVDSVCVFDARRVHAIDLVAWTAQAHTSADLHYTEGRNGGAWRTAALVRSYAGESERDSSLVRGLTTYRFRLPSMPQELREARFRVTDVSGRVYERRVLITPCPEGRIPDWTPGDGPFPGNVGLSVIPVVAEECAAPPTNRVVARFGGLRSTESARLLLHDPRQLEPIDLGVRSGSAWSQGIEIDTSELPIGSARLELQPLDPGSVTLPYSRLFPVDRTPPEVQILDPASNSRVCANDPASRVFDADVFSDTTLEYEVRAQLQPGNAAPWIDVFPCSHGSCGTDLHELGKVPTTPSRPLRGNLEVIGDSHAGGSTIRLAAFDWSGAKACATRSVLLDRSALLFRRGAPSPRILGALGPDEIVLSTRSDARVTAGSWPMELGESLDLVAHLHPAVRGHDGKYEVAGPASTEVFSGTRSAGGFNLEWDAADSGLEDGRYLLLVTGTDDCGFSKTLEFPLDLDGTAPGLSIEHPEEASMLRAPVVDVIGTARDPLFQSYELAVATTEDGPWTQLAEGSRPVGQPASLGQWVTGGQIGPRWLRLQAEDRLGNLASLVRPVTLLERAVILESARSVPAMLSPNADGRLDRTELRLQLRRAALLDIWIEDLQGTRRASLATSQSAGAGAFVLNWDGSGSAGILADGEYRLRIEARDQQVPADLDQAELSLVLDTVPPTLSLLDSEGGEYLNCEQRIGFQVNDPHLHQFDAALRDAQGAVLRGEAGNLSGEYALAATEGLPEGLFELDLRALDAAGNESDIRHSWRLDCTAPVIEWLSPEEARVHSPMILPALPLKIDNREDHPETVELLIQGGSQDPPRPVHAWTSVSGELAFDWPAQLPDGDYSLIARSLDLAGNLTEAIRSVALDSTPPDIEIESPADGSTIGRTLTVRGSVEDAQLARYQVQLAAPEDAAQEAWTTIAEGAQVVVSQQLAQFDLLTDGPLLIRVVAEDRAGQRSERVVTVQTDSLPPPVPSGLVATVDDRRHVRLNWQASPAPDLAGYHVYRNESLLNESPHPTHAYLDRDPGEALWTYTVTAIDHAGNESAHSLPASALIDLTPPLVALHRPLAASRIRGLAEIHGTAFSRDDFDSFVLELFHDGSAESTVLRRGTAAIEAGMLARWDTSSITEEQAVRIRLSARDRVGNEAEQLIEVVVDNQPPAAPQGLAAQAQDADVDVSWTPNSEADLLGYLLYRNGRLVGAPLALPQDLRPFALREARYLDPSPPDGQLNYRVYAIDETGNISPPSAPAAVDRDRDPPHVEFLRPADGLEFDQAIELIADTEQRDIRDVVFAYRMVGQSAWQALPPASGAHPWRGTLDPIGIPLGDLELQALATDLAGRLDPQPPVLRVRHADVTPPAVPNPLRAIADAHDVTITWESESPDAERFLLERRRADGVFELLAEIGSAQRSYLDSARPLGEHRYRILAEDAAGNRSDYSADAVAQVFDATIDPQPFSPLLASDLRLRGTTRVLQAEAEVQRDASDGTSLHPAGSVSNAAPFELAPVPLAPGHQLLSLRLRDAQGNRSVPVQTSVTRGLLPAAVASLEGQVEQRTVELTWQPSPEPGIAGYRIFRNGESELSDQQVAIPDALQDALTDGEPSTAWETRAAQGDDRLQASREIRLSEATLISAVQFYWDSPSSSARKLAVDGWFDGRWHQLALLGENAAEARSVHFEHAYPTDRLRVRVLRAQGYGGLHRLNEVRVLRRVLHTDSRFTVEAPEGRQVYTVSAVSELGFEGPASAPFEAEVGDAQPPSAVQLSGELQGPDALLTWTEATDVDLAAYHLYRSGNRLARVEAGAAREYRDVRLANGRHAYHVTAVDMVGNESPPSNVVELEVQAQAPARPRIDRVLSGEEGTSLHIEWSPGSGGSAVQRYRLFHSHDRDGAGDPYRELVVTESTRHRHTGLSQGERVFYKVQAQDAAGNLSAFSDPVAGQVRDLSAVPAPVISWPSRSGTRIEWREPRYDLCGSAEPGASLLPLVDSIPQSLVATALPESAITAYGGDSYQSSAALSPDGATVVTAFGAMARWSPTGSSEGGTEVTAMQGGWRELSFSPDGRRIYGLPWWGELYYWTHGNSWPSTRWTGVYEAQAYALSGDEQLLVVWGSYNGQYGLWVHREGQYGVQSVAGSRSSPPLALGWSDASNALFSQWSDGTLVRHGIQPAESAVVVSDAEPAVRLAVDSSQGQLAYARRAAGVWSVEAIGPEGAKTLLSSADPIQALAFAPDGEQLAVLHPDRLVLLDAASGGVGQTIAFTAEFRYYTRVRLQWSPAGTLLAHVPNEYAPALLFQPAGSFCVRGLPSPEGLRVLQAVASRADGTDSLPAQPVEVDFRADTTGLPDLTLAAQGIQFLPPAGAPGRPYTALVPLRNAGQAEAYGVRVSATLTDPDGEEHPLSNVDAPSYLPEGSAQGFSLPLGQLQASGLYRLRMHLDPDDLVEESDENNNIAEAELTVLASGDATIRLEAVRSRATRSAGLAGVVQVFISPGFSGQVAPSIRTPTGELVEQLAQSPIATSTQTRQSSLALNWYPAADVVPGSYQLQVELLDRSGTPIQVEQLAVQLEPEAEPALLLQVPRSHAVKGEPFALTVGIEHRLGLDPVERGRLTLDLVDSTGERRPQWTQETGVLLPGYVLRRRLSLDLSAVPPGAQWLELRWTSDSRALLAQSGFSLSDSGAERRLEGQLSLSPASRISLGMPRPALRYVVGNRGSHSESSVQARVRVRPAGQTSSLMEVADTFALPVGGERSAEVSLDALPDQIADYMAELQIQEPGGEWLRIAQLPIGSADVLPPSASWLWPQAARATRTPAGLAVVASDAHSGVRTVSYRIDGGEWLPLFVRGGEFHGLLPTLADGAYLLGLRAEDMWGNMAELPDHPVVIDNTPPTITLRGVTEGQLTNATLRPTFEVTDLHLAWAGAWLNGEPYESGTPIAAEGEFQLHVEAEDEAGNRSLSQTRFRIDLTPPDLLFLEPADGATVSTDRVDVRLQSEPGAQVRLAAGSFSAEVAADAEGVARFVGVPLLTGDNLITALATDAAGNESPSRELRVVRIQPAGALEGQILAMSDRVARGEPLRFDVEIRSTGAESLPESAYRVELHSAALVETVWRESLAIASGTVRQWTVDVATSDRPLGPVVLRLLREGDDADELLDTVSISIEDRSAPVVSWVVPQENAVLASPVRIGVLAEDDDRVVDVVVGGASLADTSLVEVSPSRWEAGIALAEGEHLLAVRARDPSGNLGTSAQRRWVVDNTPPRIVIHGVSDGALLGVATAIRVEISDPHLASRRVLLDGAEVPEQVTVSEAGLYALRVEATDLAGWTSERSIQFEVEPGPPTVAITSPLDGARTSLEQTSVGGRAPRLSTVVVEGPLSRHTVQADAEGDWWVAALSLAEGDNRIEAHATDRLGRQSAPASVSVRREADGSGPLRGSLSLATATPAVGQPVSIGIQISHTDGAAVAGLHWRVRVSAFGAADALAMRDGSIDLAPAMPHQASLSFESAAWRLGRLVASLEVAEAGDYRLLDSLAFELQDLTAPSVEWLTPAPDSYHAHSFALSAGAADEHGTVSEVQFRAGNGTWQRMTAPSTPGQPWTAAAAGLADGTTELQLVAVDDSGNRSGIQRRTVTVDTLPPVIEIDVPSEGQLSNQPVQPRVQVRDDSPHETRHTLNGNEVAPGAAISQEGRHRFRVESTDAAGNSSAVERQFEIDMTAPVVTFVSPREGEQRTGAFVDIHGSTEPRSRVELEGEYATHQVESDAQGAFLVRGVRLALGQNALRARAADRAGNQGGWSTLGLMRAGPPEVVVQLDAPARRSRGETLMARVRLSNETIEPVEWVPLRLVARLAHGGEVTLDSRTVRLAAGAELEYPVSAATHDWPQGSLTLSLRAGAEPSVQLAQREVMLEAGTAQGPSRAPVLVPVLAPLAMGILLMLMWSAGWIRLRRGGRA